MDAKLPIWGTMRAVYRLIGRRYRDFLVMSWPVLLGVTLAAVASIAFFGHGWGAFLAGLCVLLGHAVFNAAWHRVVLLNEAPGRSLDKRSLRYLNATLLLLAIAVILAMTIGMGGITLFTLLGGEALGGDVLTGVVTGLLLIIILSLLARFSFILPEVAIDRGAQIFRAWEISRGNGFRLLVIGVLLNLPLIVLSLLLAEAARGLQGTPALLALAAIDVVLQFLMLALSATLLSLAYMRLIQARRPGSAEPEVSATR